MTARSGGRKPAAPSRTIDDFEKAHDEIRLHVLRWLYARGASLGREKLENIATDTLVRTWQHWQEIENPVPWALRAASRLLIDEFRKGGREPALIGLVHDEYETSVLVAPISRPDEREDAIDVLRAMDRLPKKWAEAVLCVWILDLSVEETAKVLQLKPKTVQQYVWKSRVVLERHLQRSHPGSPRSEKKEPGSTDRMNEEVE